MWWRQHRQVPVVRLLMFKGQQFRYFSSVPPSTPFQKISQLFTWLKTTAREKGKPFIAWYASLYLGGLLGAYGIVRLYGDLEPETVKEWAKKMHADKVIDVDKFELTKDNTEYLAALLLNEAVDTPRLILAVLTIDRVILLGRKIVTRK